MEVPLDTYEDFESGIIDRDIDKMASPLEEGRINSAEIKARSAEEEELREKIDVSEREYFVCENTETTSTKETWLEVQINSFTQSTNNGYLYLPDQTRVAYRYKGDFPEKICRIFGTHYKQSVRIKCIAYMDENLKTTGVDVFDVKPIQAGLFPDTETDPEE